MRCLFFVSVLTLLVKVITSCVQIDFGHDSFACVCNASQCDYFPGPSPEIQPGQFRVTKASLAEFRLDEEVMEIEENNVVEANITIDLNTTAQFQTMIGFGGAFTDAAGMNILSLSAENQEFIIRSYFGPDGLDYNLCRVPIAGSDYSPRPYSYDDVEGDVELTNWGLQEEDYNYKFPIMHRALELTNQELYIFGSPWAPPAWMKTNGMTNESGSLITEMWQPWANYFVKFVDAYEEELGIQLWGLTTQNEPQTCFIEDWHFNCLAWTAEDQRDWIKANLGPTLAAADMRRLKLMIYDFNREDLPEYPEPMTSDPECSQYIDGIAVHWYSDSWEGTEALDETHEQSPDKFILYTEASAGFDHGTPVSLGSWERGEYYISDMIDDMNHWSTGWVDWNMALNEDGGFSWAATALDSPVIVNEEKDEFYFQPTHSAIGLFSRNVKRDAKKIEIENSYDSDMFRSTAFLNPDGTVAIVLANLENSTISFAINDEKGQVITRELGGKSWETIVYLRER